MEREKEVLKDITGPPGPARRWAARLGMVGVAGLFGSALIIGAWTVPSAAADQAPAPVLKESCEGKGVLERLVDGCPPPENSYSDAPVTPSMLHLHRQERLGFHLHNVEATYLDTIGMYTPQGSGKSYNQFRVSTAELEASGSILPGWLFAQVVIDPRDLLGKGLAVSLAGVPYPLRQTYGGFVRDAFFDINLSQEHLLRLGQQRIPFGIEAQTPGGLLPFIGRAYLDFKTPHNAGPEQTAFQDSELIQERDIGLQARGKVLSNLDYAVGVFNGSGINVVDTNNSKDFIGRVGYNPIPGIRLGASGYFGTQTAFTGLNVNRNRYGLDFEVLPDIIPHVRLMGEAAAGHDGQFYRKAWYTSAFYELIPQKSASSPGLWLAARYEELDDMDHFSRATFGFTYFFLNAVNMTSGYWQQVKFQVNYEVRNHPTTAAASPTDLYSKDMLIAQLTVRY